MRNPLCKTRRCLCREVWVVLPRNLDEQIRIAHDRSIRVREQTNLFSLHALFATFSVLRCRAHARDRAIYSAIYVAHPLDAL